MQVVEIFKELCRIPHCSHNGEAMRKYLIQKAVACGYGTAVDAGGNILCYTEGSVVTLQAHYDMVCIGDVESMAVQEDEGWLSAENSTLGADNGMGMAMMLALMAEGVKVDALFTADEEVGLLGARALGLPLKTQKLLNLDSEEEGVVTIGCAGGVDIIATLPLGFVEKELYGYEVEVSGLPGGHSGVDIDKNIPNAIKELVAVLHAKEVELCEIGGGERRNAIAKRATAIVASAHDSISIRGAKALGKKQMKVLAAGEKVLSMLHGFEDGVRAHNDELGIVQTSINLAQVSMEGENLRIQLSARSMQRDLLEAIEAQSVAYFQSQGCRVETEGFYPPWKPETNGFASEVLDVSKGVFKDAAFGAIHAGLECGIIKEKYPEIDMASIGPNICYPHSTREKVELASVQRVFEVVKKIAEG